MVRPARISLRDGPTPDGLCSNRFGGRTRLDRHRHASPYAALVLEGGYVEAGDHGRVRVGAGHVIYHRAYATHLNDFEGTGAVVLDLPMAGPGPAGVGFVDDPDLIARVAEREPRRASMLLAQQFRPAAVHLRDWPDLLAEALASVDFLGVAAWAERMGIAPQSASRGFRRAYGVSPKRYRAERRALDAAAALGSWCGSLASFAAEQGFADQAHLGRAMVSLTGLTPTRLRVQSVQA